MKIKTFNQWGGKGEEPSAWGERWFMLHMKSVFYSFSIKSASQSVWLLFASLFTIKKNWGKGMSGSKGAWAEIISERQEFRPAEGRKVPMDSQQVRRKRDLFPGLSNSCFKMPFNFLFYLFVALLGRNKSDDTYMLHIQHILLLPRKVLKQNFIEACRIQGAPINCKTMRFFILFEFIYNAKIMALTISLPLYFFDP